MSITIKELQSRINNRLAKFDGRKYEDKESSTPEYHKWYMGEIAEEFAAHGIEFLRAAIWKVVAEIDDPSGIRVSYKEVAKVKVDIKKDKRYKFGGPGLVRSIRVEFREELQDLTVEAARVFLLKEELASCLAYYSGERERLVVELAIMEEKIKNFAAITIEEAEAIIIRQHREIAALRKEAAEHE